MTLEKGRGKHILVVSQYFFPESFRINDMAVEWVKRGYKVTVLTGIPNYPQGKFYDGYSWTKKRHQVWKGIDIIRIPLIARGHTLIGMVLNYFSFVISGWFWKVFTRIKADLVFTFEVSPMTQAKIGVWYAKKHKIPNYLYVQDLWPENVESVAGVHNPLFLHLINRMVDKIYKNCTDIFVTSPSFADAIINRKVPVPSEKVHYWPQYAEEFYRPLPKTSNFLGFQNETFKIVFTGNIGYAQGLEVLPQAARLLEDEMIQFVIIGDGRRKEELIREISGVKDKFILIDRQPAEKIPEFLAACDVAFVSFADTPLFAMTIPAKLQSYMACGMPILATAKGETQRIIEEAACGVCCEIGNAAELAEAVKRLKCSSELAKMGENARKYFETHFYKKNLMDEMDAFFQSGRYLNGI